MSITINLSRSHFHTIEALESLSVARWSNDQWDKDYHTQRAIGHLQEALNAAQAAQAVQATEAPHVEPNPQSVPDSGRLNLSNESPAPSDLTHNFGA